MRSITFIAVFAAVLCAIADIGCADMRIAEQGCNGCEPLNHLLLLRDPLSQAVLSATRGTLAQAFHGLILPADGRVTSLFGVRKDPFHGRRAFHGGIDIADTEGAQVRAAGPGRVAFAGRGKGCGLVVVIDHGDGFVTRSCHLGAVMVRARDVVRAGEVIGRIGSTGRSTGPHLHFEVRAHGRSVDPAGYLWF